jgi:hypothetical protein
LEAGGTKNPACVPNMTRIYSHIIGFAIGALAVAPPIPYKIPVMVNSFSWLYMVVISALMAFALWNTKLHIAIKVLLVYLFVTCFVSEVYYFSFNAFVLFVGAVYIYQILKHSDFDIIISFIEAAFWLQVIVVLIQYFGFDMLMSFDKQNFKFFGTVFQPMRLGSLMCVMAPLLIYKSKLYLIPLFLLSLWSGTLGFSYALAVGVAVYIAMTIGIKHWKYMLTLFIILIAYCYFAAVVTSSDAFRVAVTEGRLPVWWLVVKSWALDTKQVAAGIPDLFGISQTGPVNIKSIFFGHGLDTFLPLFQYYKHDPNPFPQAHNDFLQVLWEIGLIGFIISFVWYIGDLIRRICLKGRKDLLAGLSMFGVNMNFAFPIRQTQCWLLLIAFIAFCEKEIA